MFPSDVTTGTMNLRYTGGYHVWMSAQFNDGRFVLSHNPWTGINYGGEPHDPGGINAEDLGGGQVRLTWDTEIYGTWLYQIVAVDTTSLETIQMEGPRGVSNWHFIDFPTDAFLTGEVTFSMVPPGTYVFFIQTIAWDASTLSENLAALITVGP